MQRGLGDSVGGGSEGQEDGGTRGFQSVVQDVDDLISWDWDLSARGPSGGIPQGTEDIDNLSGPSRVPRVGPRVRPGSEAERPSPTALRGAC